MSNSYRIRTKPGVDSSIKILIDQEFEYLEILSLKILKSQIYTRPCSDYGVIVGRVSVNNGLGIPNAKVSVFIPLDSVDENDPVISDIYPYKTLSELNEDGYRYNLLPYQQQHGGHTPTGTFFDREDVLVNPTLIQVYDKYYKYTAVTNESGDYMIFGIPVGSQTVTVDIDLSDIGEFSLSPQDLIRMGIAAPNQIAGTKFKSSTNLRELPQIVNINRTLEVEPLWGEPELCNLGITRADFDLSSEANIDITPTAIFMGSIISSNEDNYLKRKCKTKPNAGNLCELVTGPGEILAIRQTLKQDTYGRPLLEQFSLEEGGQVIDENGTWMIDLPMNLDYVITNEFGEQVLSNDPEKGIPTKGKYRFKVKWNQSPSVSADPIKRGYFLVPNIKEYGWEIINGDRQDPVKPASSFEDKSAFKATYTFSVDWDDYGAKDINNNITPMGAQMISEAINCEDRFYEFQYNKVYTISQLITQYRKGYANAKIIAIKDILNSECQSETNKFPTNDGMLQFDILYLLFNIMLFIFRPTIYNLLLIVHILALLMWILYPILVFITTIVFAIVWAVCQFINAIIWVINLFASVSPLDCPDAEDYENMMQKLKDARDSLTNLKIPVLSYPDCEFCNCDVGETANSPNPDDLGMGGEYQAIEESGALSVLTPFQISSEYSMANSMYITDNKAYEQLFAGTQKGDPNSTTSPLTPSTRVPGFKTYTSGGNLPNPVKGGIFTNSLTMSERLNLFNTKAKYFEGINHIKVGFNHTDNPTVFHDDNVIVLVVKKANEQIFEAGNLITFQSLSLSTDPNTTGFTFGNQFGTNSITGTTFNNSGTFTVNYADPTNPNITLTSQPYNSQQISTDAVYAKFPMDVEYFQVITGMTISDYSGMTGNTLSNSLPKRFLFNSTHFYRLDVYDTVVPNFLAGGQNGPTLYPHQYYEFLNEQRIIFLVRGVDPNTTRSDCQYDLSKLFGYSSWNQVVVKAGVNGAPKYKLNIPVQKGYKNVKHSLPTNISTDGYSGNKLYYESYHFQPDSAMFTGFTSNLPSYYSSLDTTNMSFAPNGSNTLLSVGFVSTPNGVTVHSTWNNNRFTGEVTGPTSIIGSLTVTNNNPLTTFNRGYFPGEIVEGGSAFYGTLPPNSLVPDLGSIMTFNYGNDETILKNNVDYTLLYFAPRYPSTTNVNYSSLGTNNRQIVMRSDRLPTSTTTDDNLNNSHALHSNSKFTAYYITDSGTAIASAGTGLNLGLSLTGVTQDSQEDIQDEPKIVSTVIDSFTCGKMVPLGCYDSSTSGGSSEIIIKPQSDPCYKDPLGGGKIFSNGSCYVFVSTPILSLIKDFLLLTEWIGRLNITFGACRNVFGHMFTNNWINGTLYAFTFRNDVFFSSPFADNPNQASYNYCKDVIAFHEPTNNFYYRVTPYEYSTNKFIGAEPQSGFFGGYGGNKYHLNYPTTVMDLGPRTSYIQELVMSDDYDGYVVNKLLNTSYSDVSELLNLFIINRLANTNFLLQLIAGANILIYFDSRNNAMIDGDYAQAISVNSEIGVSPFESANYPDNPSGQDPIYINTLSGLNQIFGVFFSSDTRTRDFITPKRTIINPTGSTTNQCTFSNFRVFTQEVPFYQWDVKTNNNDDSIFGSQSNDWYTKPINGDGFFSHRYQLMDRADVLPQPSSRYFRTTNQNQSEYFKGYIYSVDGSGQISGDIITRSPNFPEPTVITAGAPFHFYFGLKRGKTAFDRFTAKWIDTNKVVV